MAKAGEIVAIMCAMFCASIFVLGLAIPTTYYGFADEDSTCQEGERGGINLSDWVKGAGLSAICVTGWVWAMAGLAVATEHEAFVISGIVVCILDIFFWIAWWIWGIVVLTTNENNTCVSDGKGMAVMAIINLAIGEVRFAYVKMLAGANE
jgi:hypothetical protein